MPVDHSKNGFLKDIGTDWVALSPNGTPLARAHDEETVRRAVPDAAEYVTGKKPKAEKVEAAPAAVEPEPATVEPEAVEVEQTEPVTAELQPPVTTGASAFDHDGDGRDGGSLPGEQSTVATGRRKRKPVA